MKIAIVTNIRSPYRVLQIEEIAKCNDYYITVYYTDTNNLKGRDWDSKQGVSFKEIILEGKKISSKYGYINKGLAEIVINNDLVVIGGYSQPSYVVLCFLCKLYKKQYALIFDGITIGQEKEENLFKNIIKKALIHNANAYFANGVSGMKFFNEFYNQPAKKIFNQYLTVDTRQINNLKKDYSQIRNSLRNRYNIAEDEKVLLYCGRVISIKNLFRVVDALALIDEEITFFITGGGELQNDLKNYADEKEIKVIMTGFLRSQEDVFSHYFIGDTFILPSIEEPWGLVVNEAMAAGLNVIVSDKAGCALDLVDNNGELIDPFNVISIKTAITNVLINKKYSPIESEKIIKDWTFENSAKSFFELIKSLS